MTSTGGAQGAGFFPTTIAIDSAVDNEVQAWTSLSNAESIAIVVEKNPAPWATSVDVMPGAGGLYSTRIKMGQTSPVTCYVKAGGKVHKAAHVVKVTVGGCGG